MSLRECVIFQGKVNIEKGYCQTKNKQENKGSLNNSGYYLINLKPKGSKHFRVLTMQLAIYLEANGIQEIPKGFCLHHIDNNTGNNKILNISLCMPKLNCYFAAKNRDYAAIYEKRKQNGFKQKIKATSPDNSVLLFDSMSKCAKHFETNPGTISKIVNKKKYYNNLVRDNKTWNFCRA